MIILPPAYVTLEMLTNVCSLLGFRYIRLYVNVMDLYHATLYKHFEMGVGWLCRANEIPKSS